jgi:uncharacterized membrane protein YozB (DUF420 family)
VGIVVVALATVAFLIYQTPPYFSFDPAHARRPMTNLHYWLIVGHVVFGTVAVLTVVLQLWPWLRREHPAVHRWAGRVYVFGGALPAAVFAVSMWRIIPDPGSVGVVMSAVLWTGTALAGWRMGQLGRYREHRRYMLYSFAIVWGVVLEGFAIGQIGLHVLPQADFGRLIESVRWVPWVADLVVVQWWLNHTAGRPLDLPQSVLHRAR